MKTIDLNGTWSVRAEPLGRIGETGVEEIGNAEDGWLPAQVPGEIHLDLIRAGQMLEPTIGANMPGCRWPETKSWWYRRVFELDPEFLQHERQQLVFDGMDLYAQVFVNGRLAGEAADAFVPVTFDLKKFLRAGQNDLVVRLTAGSELAKDETPAGQGQPWKPNRAAQGEIPNPMSRAGTGTTSQQGELYAHRGWAGRKWLRKPQFSYGWDWVDALPNIGIWRGVHLEGRTGAIIQDLRLDTLIRAGRVFLEMEAILENLHPWSERRVTLELVIQPPDGGQAVRCSYPVDTPPGRIPVRDVFEIPDAKLWWPNEMGDQPLYQVQAQIIDATGIACDQRLFSIGLRTIEIDRTHLPLRHPDEGLAYGSRFCFRVNGQEVFCRGGNLGPQDPILARVSDAKYEKLVAEAKNAHFNMFRINGCSVFEGPAFFEACDRAGILIWHDFLLTDITYPDEEDSFCEAVRAEVETAIRNLRHHPSIALWCGCNENTWFFSMINQDKSLPLDIGGQRLYYQILPEVCRLLDPRRIYWPSSPCGGEDPNSELEGNCHWWYPFFMNSDIHRRIRHEVFDECRARFVSEYGVIGPCHLDSIHEYLAPEEMQPGHPSWQMHTNTFEKETVPAAIRWHYADPEGLTVPEYVLYGQMFQAIIHGHAMEALRFRKHDPVDDCQGALIWSYSDCWGETGWSILDYYLRRKASYYWFRRACAPLKVIVRQRRKRLVTRLINDTLQPYTGVVEVGWWQLDGSQREVETRTVTVPANDMLEIADVPASPPAGGDLRQWLYAAVLRGAGGDATDQSIWTLLPHRQLSLASPEIKVKVLPDGWLEVASPVYCHGVHTEDHGGEIVSDNWFDLLPGVSKLIHLAKRNQPELIEFTVIAN